jgi:hypothetical protein
MGFDGGGEVVDVYQERVNGDDFRCVGLWEADEPFGTRLGLEQCFPWFVLWYIARPEYGEDSCKEGRAEKGLAGSFERLFLI